MKGLIASVVTALSLTALAPGGERGGEFRQSEVAAGAAWFLHLDLVQLKSGKIGEQLMAEIDEDAERKIRAFKRMISFNPFEDLDAVTLYGTAAGPESAVALVRGVFDVPHLTDLVTAADGHEATEHAGKVIHGWSDANTPAGRLFGCLVSDRQIVLGPDVEVLKAAVDTVAGGGDSLADTGALGAPAGGAPPIVSAAAGLSALADLDIESAFVQQMRSLYLAAGESEGKVFARVVVEVDDERTPKLMAKMLAGVLAFGEASDKLPEGAADAVAIEVEAGKLSASGEMDLDLLLEMMQGLKEITETF